MVPERNPFEVGFAHVPREYHVVKEIDRVIWNVEKELSSKQFLGFHENLNTVCASVLELMDEMNEFPFFLSAQDGWGDFSGGFSR